MATRESQQTQICLQYSTEANSYQQKIAEYENLYLDLKNLRIELADKKKYLLRLNQGSKWLEAALQNFENEFSPQLNQAANQYLKILTDNRYDSVHIARDFSMKIDAATDLTMKPSEVFSAGTYDQAFLAQRLALTSFLDKNLELPLLCDDPFVNYDQERMVSGYKLLAKISREENRQILLVTCHPLPGGFFPESENCTWQIWENSSH